MRSPPRYLSRPMLIGDRDAGVLNTTSFQCRQKTDKVVLRVPFPRWIQTKCDRCKRAKSIRQEPENMRQNLLRAAGCWQCIAYDRLYIGPMLNTRTQPQGTQPERVTSIFRETGNDRRTAGKSAFSKSLFCDVA